MAIVIRVVVAAATHFTAEDYLITLRYAENIAWGRGFTYNPGDRVLGTTTPLYTLLLAGARIARLSPTAVGRALDILAAGVLCAAVYVWMWQMRQERAGIAAAFLVALGPQHVRWDVSGMETSLVTLCGVVVWLLYAGRRYQAAYAVLGVLFLLRWDSLLLAAILTAAILWRERRVPCGALGLFAAIVTPWLAWSAWYFGSPIPVTGIAKMTVYGWRAGGHGLPQLHRLVYWLYGTPGYAALAALALTGLWISWRQRIRDLAAPVLWFALYWVAFLLSRNLLFEWYLVPPLPVYEVLVAIGLIAVAGVACRVVPQRAHKAAAWICAVAAAVSSTMLTLSACMETQRIEDHLREPIGKWLASIARPGDRVMLEPIGYIGYYSHLRVLDTVGLVSPEVLQFYQSGNQAPMLDIALTFRPEWCVLRPGELNHILGVARAMGVRWEDHYRLVRTFSYTPRPTRELITFHIFRRVNGISDIRS